MNNIKEELVKLGKISKVDGAIAWLGVLTYAAFYGCIGAIAYLTQPKLTLAALGFYIAFRILGHITSATVRERYRKMEKLILADLESKWLDKAVPVDEEAKSDRKDTTQ